MPKMVKIENLNSMMGGIMPLRVTHRQERVVRRRKDGSVAARSGPSLRVKCGCCNEAIELYHIVDFSRHGITASNQTLEIGGVMGTVAQWRQVLLPLLGVAIPHDEAMHYDHKAEVLRPFVEGSWNSDAE